MCGHALVELAEARRCFLFQQLANGAAKPADATAVPV